MAAPPKLCWICRTRAATTREHNFKQTDVVDIGVSQSSPLYFNDATHRNVLIKGKNSPYLKAREPNLCDECNNVLTQPYDKTWEELGRHLKANPIKVGDHMDFRRIFPADTTRKMRHVHLWLTKRLGCVLADYGRYDDTELLSLPLLRDMACGCVYLAVSPPKRTSDGLVQHGEGPLRGAYEPVTHDLLVANFTYTTLSATWTVVFERHNPPVTYATPLWHPRLPGFRIEVLPMHPVPAEGV